MTTGAAFERLRDALEGQGHRPKRVGEGWNARCPAHDDGRPSLSFRDGDGQALLYCHAGCDTADVMSALGLEMRDLFDNRRDITYTYTMPDGRTNRTVTRKPNKEFPQRIAINVSVLYRLDRVTEAVADGRTIYLVAGEKDVHTLERSGLTATTNPGGESNFGKVDVAPLRGVHVVAVVDRDGAGAKWAKVVQQRLDGVAASLTFVEAATGKDATDHIVSGHTIDEFSPYAVDDDQAAERPRRVTARPVPLAQARETFGRWMHIDDEAPMLYVAATVAANNADGDPLWTLLVGPPSAGKTEVAMATAGLPYVHPAATISESALLSGVSRKEQDKGATGGLLKQIGSYGIILAKDFTSILSQNKDTAAAALAALREVYDGSWSRPVGAGGGRVLTWNGKCGLLGCVTPSIDRYAQVVGALGDRYLMLRLPDADPRSMAASALGQGTAQQAMRAELAEAMTGLIEGADLGKVGRHLDQDEQERLIRLAEYTARARTAVERNGYTREIEVLPQPEGTGRLVGQMRRLFGGLEAIGCAPDTAWGVVERVARDCVPAIRTKAIELLLKVDEISTAKVAETLRIDWKTAQRHLEDMRLLDLVEVRVEDGKGSSIIYHHRATEWLRNYRP